MQTPISYARQLCTYIASPLKVESLTKMHFGEAPPLHVIAKIRVSIEQDARKFREASNPKPSERAGLHLEAFDYRPRGLVKEMMKEALKPLPPHEVTYASGHKYRRAQIFIDPHYQPPVAVIGHDDLKTVVAHMFMIRVEDLTGRGRRAQFNCARMVAAKLFIERGNSMAQAGRFLKRDHTTICHHMRAWPDHIRRWPKMLEAYERLSHLSVKPV